jgi:hypothetical protein
LPWLGACRIECGDAQWAAQKVIAASAKPRTCSVETAPLIGESCSDLKATLSKFRRGPWNFWGVRCLGGPLQMSEQEFRALVLSTIRQATPVEAARAINARLASEDPDKAVFIRDLQIIRDSIDIALSSKKRDVAESRMKLLIETWKRAEAECSGVVPQEAVRSVGEVVADAQRRFQTSLYANIARGYLDKAKTLKTAKAQEGHLSQARAAILEGLGMPDSNKAELGELMFSVERMRQAEGLS